MMKLLRINKLELKTEDLNSDTMTSSNLKIIKEKVMISQRLFSFHV